MSEVLVFTPCRMRKSKYFHDFFIMLKYIKYINKILREIIFKHGRKIIIIFYLSLNKANNFSGSVFQFWFRKYGVCIYVCVCVCVCIIL